MKFPRSCSGFQLRLNILAFQEQARRTPAQVGPSIPQKSDQRGHGAGRDDINFQFQILGPDVVNRGGKTERRAGLLEKPAALGHAFDQVHMGARLVLQEDGQDQTWKAGAGPKVGPDQGVRRQRQKLGGIVGVSEPEGGKGRWADQVQLGVSLRQKGQKPVEVRQLRLGHARRGGEGHPIEGIREGQNGLGW